MATTWFVLGAVLGQDAEAGEELQNQIIGLAGLAAVLSLVEVGTRTEKVIGPAKKVQVIQKTHHSLSGVRQTEVYLNRSTADSKFFAK